MRVLLATVLAAAFLLPAARGMAETIAFAVPGAAPRDVELLLPRQATPGRPALLVVLHGRYGSGAQILRQSGLAARPGLIVAAPDGYRRSWASGRGQTPADREGVDDVAFLRALIGTLVARHGADPARVYVAGMSNGGFMAARLACEASDILAGIAIVGATSGQGLAQGCRGGGAVSVLLIHGTADPLVRADGTAPRQVGPIMGAQQAARFWAAQAGCTGASAPRPLPVAGVPDGSSGQRTDFAPCRGAARVAFIEILGGAHAWPGSAPRRVAGPGGPPSTAVDASAEILAFFGLPRN